MVESSIMTLPTIAEVRAASLRLRNVVRSTPLLEVSRDELGLEAGAPVVFKLEHLQHSGSFKARGATNFLATNEIGPGGVAAASGGNHGAAVAWAAKQRGLTPTIFVPTISNPSKVDRLRSYGADVRQVGSIYSESLEACLEHVERFEATNIHAYNHPSVMAGAATVTTEFVDQVERSSRELDTILYACGGGGLAGGAAIASYGDGSTKGPAIIACEGERTSAYASAVRAGHPVDVEVSGVTADALGATQIGELAWEALSRVDAAGLTVRDEVVLEARRWLWTTFRVLVEPAVATTVAVLRAGMYRPAKDEVVGVVLCGANTGFDDLE